MATLPFPEKAPRLAVKLWRELARKKGAEAPF